MGSYLNPSSRNFLRSISSEIYIDKSQLIAFTNKKVNTQQSYICVSRPRRFGKSMAADMLAAYYGCGEDTRELFANLKIAQDKSFEKNLNHYNVLKIDMQAFMSKANSVKEMLNILTDYISFELVDAFPTVRMKNKADLAEVLGDVFNSTNRQFVILIDEWDCVMRRYHSEQEKKEYLDFLRNLMKDKPYVALAYMTGILPIKKYGEHSTLNMFYEYSMIDSAEISDCFGFTDDEVAELCERYGMNLDTAKEWYDGYRLISEAGGVRKEYSIYSPKSISESMLRHRYDAYWNQTETYEALKVYIEMNMDGLKDAIVEMLAGASVEIDTGVFHNDMFELHSRDEVLTLLVHLGYLAYNQDNATVSIPNKEVSNEFVRSVRQISSWGEVARSIQNSKSMLQAVWDMDGAAVAAGIEKAHQEVSILQYNNENSLSCTIGLAFYYAREYYNMVREMPTGKGFADICFVPRPNHLGKPAIVAELKWDKSIKAAISQIKEKNYPDSLRDYKGKLLLVGINYNREAKTHECAVEAVEI
ncbi:MAG: AAA family ATPase [Oscillospiraceae bacterium]|nr:AAA family ATPase [Oscillospiraceae bacterium]